MEINYLSEGEFDAYLFGEGTYYRSYEFLGAHKVDERFHRFVVWAPRAREVFLVGDFNNWNNGDLPMRRIGESGLWNILVDGVSEYDCYKYRIISYEGEERIKSDPYGFHFEERPNTASKVYNIRDYQWTDNKWLKDRKLDFNAPMSIYEVNLLSWRQKEDGVQYSYVELARDLVSYVKKMGYTHIELMPITEFPFDGSWGYQTTGYFAPTSRFGTPKDLMYLIDQCHRNNIGVILDWVPVHFCKDDFALARFDGTYCYESSDHAKAENEQWGTLNFDFSKGEVLSFLISSAMYWLDYYHIDGIRVDAVAYMLYHDFGGKDIKNIYGGRENLEAVEFIKRLNSIIKKNYPEAVLIAEESTTWPMISHPVEDGGLGFDYKWNMGWMNDVLKYMEMDPIFRKDHQHLLTFSIMYAFSEKFILPLSHDEVVHGKKSLLDKMPGSYEEKFSGLRLLYLYMYAHPGKKLLFMGGEFGQFIEWDEWKELDWFLLDYPLHQGMKVYVEELNKLYRDEKILWEVDTSYDGFKWIEHENHQESILAFERIDSSGNNLICIFNFTPVARVNYPIGVNRKGTYKTLINSDHKRYGGDLKRVKSYKTLDGGIHHRDYRIEVDIPPMGGLFLKLKEE